MLFAPLFLIIPGAATGSALVVEGISMMETLRTILRKDKSYLPKWPAWIMGVLMIMYFIF